MATTAERILEALDEAGSPLDDDQLAALLGVARQQVNQACRKLETKGLIARRVPVGGKIQRLLIGVAYPAPEPVVPAQPGDLLTEDEVKTAVRDHLQARGYRVTVAWGQRPGIDIAANKDSDRILIEAKGEVLSSQQQGNYFLNALGELIQRLDDPGARYGLALPDNKRYRGLVKRLPALARDRLDLVVYMVSRTADGFAVIQA